MHRAIFRFVFARERDSLHDACSLWSRSRSHSVGGSNYKIHVMSDKAQEEGQSVAASDNSTVLANQRRLEQNQILTELGATVNTLMSISHVLDDISASSMQVARKQELLLEELGKWKDLT